MFNINIINIQQNNWNWKSLDLILFVNFLTMLCTYLDLKTKFHEIEVILSSVGILFAEDSTFCSAVTCFKRNRSVSHFHCKISSPGLNVLNLRRLSISIITSNFIWMTHGHAGTSCPKFRLKSTCLTAKFGSFLDHAKMGEKDKLWSILLSNIWFLLFFQSMFLLQTMWNLLTSLHFVNAEICYDNKFFIIVILLHWKI